MGGQDTDGSFLEDPSKEKTRLQLIGPGLASVNAGGQMDKTTTQNAFQPWDSLILIY